MSPIRQDALTMIQTMPENQLQFIVGVMRELSRLMPAATDTVDIHEQAIRDDAFALLESMRRKIPDLDYNKELAEYREEKYL